MRLLQCKSESIIPMKEGTESSSFSSSSSKDLRRSAKRRSGGGDVGASDGSGVVGVVGVVGVKDILPCVGRWVAVSYHPYGGGMGCSC